MSLFKSIILLNFQRFKFYLLLYNCLSSSIKLWLVVRLSKIDLNFSLFVVLVATSLEKEFGGFDHVGLSKTRRSNYHGCFGGLEEQV